MCCVLGAAGARTKVSDPVVVLLLLLLLLPLCSRVRDGAAAQQPALTLSL